jgi:ABC-type dipeptide/oligopeptide/nickel transport system ATPase component
VLLMALIAAIGPETVPVMAMFGVLLSPGFFRLTRTAVRNVRGELYIDAARVSGLSDARILRRHVTSVVRSPIIIQASISVGIATLMQTGLQFLGLGDTTVPSWGQMLSDAFTNIYAAPTLVIWPGATIGLTVAALALLGSSLSDALVDRPATRRAGRRRAAETARAVAAVVSGVDGSDRSPAAGRRRPAEPGAPGGDELLRVSGLSVSYPQPSGEDRRVLHDIELTVSRGEVLGLIGESGSGKTQTAFAVLGLLPAAATVSGGSIVFDGIALAGDPRAVARLRGRRIAYIPQEPMSNLDPAFTVGSQLVEPMRVVLGLSRAAARTRAMDLLERVGIAQPRRVFASYPHQISGGMAQRVLIAGAVSGNPDLLIADEPTTALDVTVQAEVLDLLRELQQERRMAMLMVTHNFGVVADICDRVAVMQDGRIVEQDEVRAIFTRASHPYTRSLVEAGMDNATARPPLSTAATVPAREGGAR